MLARRCIDGTERRPHLGGALGAAMLERMLALRWVAKISGSRALRTTSRGQQAFGRLTGHWLLDLGQNSRAWTISSEPYMQNSS